MSSITPEITPIKNTSELLRHFTQNHTSEKISVRELVHAFEDRGLAFLLLIFALLCTIPIPIPGIHIFLSLPLWYITMQQMTGRRHLWLPEKVLNHDLPRQAFVDITQKCLPWLAKVEQICKPRMIFFTNHFFYIIYGAICMFFTAVIAVPGPLTNFMPAVGISLIALGIITRDGLVMLIGAIVGIAWSIFLAIFYVGTIMFLYAKAMEVWATL